MPKYIFIIAIVLAGCAHRTPGYESSSVKGIKIINDGQAAALHGYAAQDLENPFPAGSDGTKVILDFLAAAKNKGASYVSNIKITLSTQAQKCETLIAPEEDIKTRSFSVQTPGHYENRNVLKPVTQTLTEFEYRCQMVSVPVQTSQTTYTYQYDAFSKTSRQVPQTHMVTSYQMQNQCTNVPVTRTVTRYQYQFDSQYIPPRTDYLTQKYSEWKLAESKPACRALNDGDKPEAGAVISAKIYIQN